MRTDTNESSTEVKLVRSRLLRGLLMLLGGLCVVFAVIGLFVPGWPTTIWLIVAAWLFSRSSPRFYALIINHRVFGPIVRDYRAGNGIPVRIKVLAISCIVIFAGSSAFLLIDNPAVRLTVVAAAMFGIGFLSGLPTRPPYRQG